MICKKFISIIFRSIERLDKTSEPPRHRHVYLINWNMTSLLHSTLNRRKLSHLPPSLELGCWTSSSCSSTDCWLDSFFSSQSFTFFTALPQVMGLTGDREASSRLGRPSTPSRWMGGGGVLELSLLSWLNPSKLFSRKDWRAARTQPPSGKVRLTQSSTFSPKSLREAAKVPECGVVAVWCTLIFMPPWALMAMSNISELTDDLQVLGKRSKVARWAWGWIISRSEYQAERSFAVRSSHAFP